MEYLDYYDLNGKFIGKASRDKVHAEGLWHKTIHCWLYDDFGNVYFQLRAENNKMYTTASGHVDAGESLNRAFAREVKEEIGVDVEIENAELIEIVVWKMDKKKSDGTVWKDRAFANVYANKINAGKNDFVFDKNEVNGLIKIKAEDALKILCKEVVNVNAVEITGDGQKKVQISLEDFLVNPHEIGIIKYGRVLQFIIEKIKSKI